MQPNQLFIEIHCLHITLQYQYNLHILTDIKIDM